MGGLTAAHYDAIESPCISRCEISGDSPYCRGCARTMDEISRWWLMDAQERTRVMATLDARRGAGAVAS